MTVVPTTESIKPNNLTIPIISWQEFVVMVNAYVIENFKDYERKDLIAVLVGDGFPKLTVDTVKIFLKEAFIYINPQVIVEFGNNEFYWLVSGMDAILIHKPKV